MKKILFLFAPKFKAFGVDVARELILSSPELSIGGLCTGGQSVVTYVKENCIKEKLLFADNLEALEKKWLAQSDKEIDYEYLAGIDEKYGHGAVGEVIIADRRVGRGFVRGGLTRPDEIGDAVLGKPVEATQKYIQGLFQYIEKIFDENKFDGVFCYAVAGGPAVALALICRVKGILFTRLNVTRIGDGFVVDTDYKGRLVPIAKRFISNEVISEELTERSRTFLKNYRDKPVNPGYMIYNQSILKKNRFLPLLKNLFIYTSAIVLKPILLKKHKKMINSLDLNRKLFDLKIEWNKINFDFSIFYFSIPSCNYLYFPLHVDPEASTMVMSPMHTDQISVIEAISKSLPGDKVLVVKEHLPMVGKRSKIFYEQIKNMPKVILVSPNLNAHDLILSSDGVVVITGTAALEAVLLRKKTIVIGDSPYLAMNTGMIHEPCLCKLPETIANLEDMKSPDDEKLIRYIACALDESFEMGSSVLWGEYSCIDPEEKTFFSRSIALKINYLMNETL